jgi:hypothetical protein
VRNHQYRQPSIRLRQDHQSFRRPIPDHLTQNRLTQNHPTQDRLTQDSLTQDSLTQDSLTQDSLTQDSPTQGYLTPDYLTRDRRALTHFQSQTLLFPSSCISGRREEVPIVEQPDARYPATEVQPATRSDSATSASPVAGSS